MAKADEIEANVTAFIQGFHDLLVKHGLTMNKGYLVTGGRLVDFSSATVEPKYMYFSGDGNRCMAFGWENGKVVLRQ